MALPDTSWTPTNWRPWHGDTMSIDGKAMVLQRTLFHGKPELPIVLAHDIGMEAWVTEGGVRSYYLLRVRRIGEWPGTSLQIIRKHISSWRSSEQSPRRSIPRNKQGNTLFGPYEIGQSLGSGSLRLHMENIKNDPPTLAPSVKPQENKIFQLNNPLQNHGYAMTGHANTMALT